MLEEPTLYCEIIEQMWTSSRYDSSIKILSVVVKDNTYAITGETVPKALKLLENSTDRVPDDLEIVRMLVDMNYNGDMYNFGQIYRRCIRNKWTFLCDSIIKAFSGKVSNFDAFTTSIQVIAYMLFTADYFNIGELVLYEIVAKLGPHEKRTKNIYFARF